MTKRGCCMHGLHSVFLLKFINTSACINKLLFTGEMRVTVRANFHAEILLDRSGFKRIAASASYRRHEIFRLNFCFHWPFTSFRPASHWQPRVIYRHISALYHVRQIRRNFFYIILNRLLLGRNVGIRADHDIRKLRFKNFDHALHSVNIALRFRDET